MKPCRQGSTYNYVDMVEQQWICKIFHPRNSINYHNWGYHHTISHFRVSSKKPICAKCNKRI